ncbi:MAG: carbohydrate binding domain-containing protein [Capsulimonadales bacterium]|nr:carbohydrate binding domain-containing protein [Capsulimonadales bacterium]
MERFSPGHVARFLLTVLLCAFFVGHPSRPAYAQSDRTGKRWLFVWRDMTDPKEVDKVIARLPRAKAAGYNGVAVSYNVAPAKATELREAAKRHGIAIVAIVMGGPHDRNYVEGVPVTDARFVAKNGVASHVPDNPTKVVNGDFEDVRDHHFNGWGFQDDEGVTTFADHDVTHGGKTSLRMENVGKNPDRHCRISQLLTLKPNRQYHISFWIKTENLTPADPEVKILTADARHGISFQSFRVDATQDWKRYDLVFNSLENTDARLYLGSWYGKDGKMWWDDLSIEEIGLVNVIRRPGCPVTVKGENGVSYEEGRDYERIVDPQYHPWIAYHDAPSIRLTPTTRIKDGESLRVSYYHPLIVYEDRVTGCLSEPKIFEDWRAEVKQANERLRPAAFLMSHDELRVANRCGLCRSKNLTAGELLAWNVRQAAQILRQARPDAEIWVWNDMFDPMHNAVDRYYAVRGSLKGSWKGLAKDVGIVNWYGGLMGKNCRFFADLGLKQILAGYYDGDEDGSAIVRWQAATKGIPGIVGAMYTTWEDKYDAMTVWATKAWGGSGR